MIPRNVVIPAVILLLLATGMSLYLWQLRRREASSTRPPRVATQHVTPPVSGPTENVTVFVVYDTPGELRTQSISIPIFSDRQRRAEELLRGLLNIYAEKNSPHPLAPGAEVREVYLVSPDLAVIDVSSALADGHTSGVLAEELTVVSLIQTLTRNIPGIMRVKILADGKERETLAGHADLSGFYDVSQVSQVAQQLTRQ